MIGDSSDTSSSLACGLARGDTVGLASHSLESRVDQAALRDSHLPLPTCERTQALDVADCMTIGLVQVKSGVLRPFSRALPEPVWISGQDREISQVGRSQGCGGSRTQLRLPLHQVADYRNQAAPPTGNCSIGPVDCCN